MFEKARPFPAVWVAEATTEPDGPCRLGLYQRGAQRRKNASSVQRSKPQGRIDRPSSRERVINVSWSSFRPVHDPAQPLPGAHDMLPHRLAGSLLIMSLDCRSNREVLIEGCGLGSL